MGMLGPSRTDWSPEMDQYFIELMINQIGRRDKIENTFTKQAWTEMLSLFNERFGPQHGKRVLRHRYKKLWMYYNDIAVMLAQDGFSWDEEQQMLAADSDVWDAYVKVYSILVITVTIYFLLLVNGLLFSCRNTHMRDHIEQNPCLTTKIWA